MTLNRRPSPFGELETPAVAVDPATKG